MVSARFAVMGQRLNEVRSTLARQARALNLRHGAVGVPALVLMTDDTRRADWVEAATALPQGSCVIVRHRDASAREALALALRRVCRGRRLKLLIADDPALAVRVRADGVHMPQVRLRLLAGLRARYPRWLLTAAAHDAAAVTAAAGGGADAIFVSPVFATASHPGAQVLGAVGFAALVARACVPVLALGGIDGGSIQRLAPSGAAGAGVIGAWVRS